MIDFSFSSTNQMSIISKRNVRGSIYEKMNRDNHQSNELQADMAEAMIENGVLSAVSEWLAPLPDKSLPALEIRTTMLKILRSFGRLETVRG